MSLHHFKLGSAFAQGNLIINLRLYLKTLYLDMWHFKWASCANYVGVSCVLFCKLAFLSPFGLKVLCLLCCVACTCSSALDSSGHWTGMADIQKSERRREIRACTKVHSHTCGSSYIFAFFNVTGLNQMPWGHISALVTYQEFEPFL